MIVDAEEKNSPHRQVKCLGVDWCMHEGEWRRGKASGKGKFSWPSNATFIGELRSNRIEGFGTFTELEGNACLGDTEHKFRYKWYTNDNYHEGG